MLATNFLRVYFFVERFLYDYVIYVIIWFILEKIVSKIVSNCYMQRIHIF